MKKTAKTSKKLIKSKLAKLNQRRRDYLDRRPHRSFRRTRRRDYVRSMEMPGYWAFTFEVVRTLKKHKSIFIKLALLFGIASILIGGVMSNQTYDQIRNLYESTKGSAFDGNWGQLAGGTLILLTTLTTGSNANLSEIQSAYLVFCSVMVWLTTVWLLRHFQAGRQAKLRDGLYQAGAPIVSTFLVVFVFMIQILPLGILALIYSGLFAGGFIQEGYSNMLFTLLGIAVLTLCLYWATSTFLAMIIVTLPGMYPLKALSAAGDLVMGRRLRILLRLLWMFLTVIVGWLVVVVPIILFDSWLKDLWDPFNSVPLVPLAIAIMTSFMAIWASSYIYLLYRRIVEDESKPA